MSHSFTASQLIGDHSLFLQLGIWSNDWQGLEGRQERSHKVLMFNHCVITLICPFRILKPTGRYDLCRVRFCWCRSHLVSSATNTRWDYLIDRIVAILAERARNLASAANCFHAKLDSGSPIPVVLRKKTGSYSLQLIFTSMFCTVNPQQVCLLWKCLLLLGLF